MLLSEYFFLISLSIKSFFLFFFFGFHNFCAFLQNPTKVPFPFRSIFLHKIQCFREKIHFSSLYLQPTKMFLLLFKVSGVNDIRRSIWDFFYLFFFFFLISVSVSKLRDFLKDNFMPSGFHFSVYLIKYEIWTEV